jgi:hypothetical protein
VTLGVEDAIEIKTNVEWHTGRSEVAFLSVHLSTPDLACEIWSESCRMRNINICRATDAAQTKNRHVLFNNAAAL